MGRPLRQLASLVVVGLAALGWQRWSKVDARPAVAEPTPGAARTGRVERVRPIGAARVQPELALDDAGEAGDDAADEADPDQVEDDTDLDGLTAAQRWESRVAELEDRLPHDRGAITGDVIDGRTGDGLAGVTVVVSGGALEGALAAITEDHGHYSVYPLPPGHYTTTFYYADVTIERSEIVVTARRATPLFQLVVEDARPAHDPVVAIEEDLDDDAPEISFSGIESQTNTYVVDSIDVTGLTFGGNE